MSRPLREHFEGSLYHVRSLGNSKQQIFFCDDDRRLFLYLLGEVVAAFKWLCHGYCLMGNHYHLIVETPADNVSAGMHYLNGSFAQKINYLHNRTGHLLEGRFRSKLVDNEIYFLVLSRYLALNPVASGLTRYPHEWPWSSFYSIYQDLPDQKLLTTSFLLSFFSADGVDPLRAYEEFVLEGLESARSARKRPSLDALINVEAEKLERERSICAAVLEHGYSQREVARYRFSTQQSERSCEDTKKHHWGLTPVVLFSFGGRGAGRAWGRPRGSGARRSPRKRSARRSPA